MRGFLFSLLAFSFVLVSSADAADYSILKDGIRGYRNLTNTPEAPLIEFRNKEGKLATLADYRGKTILLNFWATWCPPCVREMPALNELAAEFKSKNMVVIAIASGRQGREKPDDWLERRDLKDIISYHDRNQNFLRLFKINTLPVTFVIDENGLMQGGVIGMTEWDSPETKTVLRELLK